MHLESDRIRFLVERDGIVVASETIRMYMNIYRSAVLNKNHHAASRHYRETFILSYLEFKRFLLNQF